MGYFTKKRSEPTVAIKKRLLITLLIGITLISITAVSFVIDPLLALVNIYTRIENGSMVYQILNKEADAVHVSVYLFNITNADRFLSGEDRNLKVEEVGPFTYQENRTNNEFTINKECGTMGYIPRSKVTFLPEESVGRPEETHVVMPNVALLSMASRLSPFSFLMKGAYNLLVGRLDSQPIIKMSAHDYLWGYDEPLIKLGNTFLPGWIDFSKLGLLDRLFDKNTTYRFEVSTRNEDKFAVKTVNGVGGLNQWEYDDPEKRTKCNSFTNAYEGIGYPPDLPASRPLRFYRPILCRFFEMEYTGIKQMKYGVDALSYQLSNRTYDMKDPDNKCLCRNGICLDGVSDMSPCFYGLPVVLSNPHFMNADPSIHNRVEGMEPDEENHGSEFAVDPFTGIMLTTKFCVQVNIKMDDVSFSPKASKFSGMLLPVAYVKTVQPELPPEAISFLVFIRNRAPYILLGLQFILVLIGLLCITYSVKIMYWSWINPRRKGVVLELTNAEVISAKNANFIEPLVINGLSN